MTDTPEPQDIPNFTGPAPHPDSQLVDAVLAKLNALRLATPAARQNLLSIAEELIRIVGMNEQRAKRIAELEASCRQAVKLLSTGL